MREPGIKTVAAETTTLRLCQAVQILKKISEVLGYETPISEAVDEIEEAILDLCGVPDGASWSRDLWYDDFSIEPQATPDEILGVIQRMKEINQEASALEKDLPEPRN